VTGLPAPPDPSEAPDLLGALAMNEAARAAWERIGPEGQALYLMWLRRRRTRRSRARAVEEAVRTLATDPYAGSPITYFGPAMPM
jgi:hypothetical protein